MRLEEYVPEIRRTMNVLAYSPQARQLALLCEDVTALKVTEASRLAGLEMIDTLREISLEAIARLDPGIVAQKLIDRLDQMLPFDSASILLVEPNSLKVQHQVWRGEDQHHDWENGQQLDDQWLFTRMATSTRPLVIPDVMKEPEWPAGPGQDNVQSFAGVPILIRDELAGFINCESHTPGFYRMESVRRPLETVAALAALAFDNARHSGEQQYRVTHDPLTGLNNQTILLYLLEHALELARRQRTNLALIYLDLVGFGAVNQVFGRDRGDQVLRSVADRLQNCLRGSDILARPGDDEFVVILENIAREEDAALVANKLSHELSEPHIIQDQQVVVQASSGVAIFPRDGDNPEEMLQAAHRALASKHRQADA